MSGGRKRAFDSDIDILSAVAWLTCTGVSVIPTRRGSTTRLALATGGSAKEAQHGRVP